MIAAEQTIAKVMKKMEASHPPQAIKTDVYDSDDSDDSEGSYMKDVVQLKSDGTRINCNLPYSRETLSKFVYSLPYNLISFIGFDAVGYNPEDEKSCSCSCPLSMSAIKWRTNFDISFMNDNDKCSGYHKNALPFGLMDHVRKLGESGGYLHLAVQLYLETLHAKKWGSIGHKALYKPGDENYKKAEAAEKKERDQ